MQLKKILVIYICLVSLLCGCASRQKSITRVSKVSLYTEAKGAYTFCFYISHFSSKENHTVKLIAIDGTNTSDISYSIKDVTPSYIEDHTVNKGYFGYYMVECTSDEDIISINKLVLEIDNENIEVEIADPISVNRVTQDEGHCLSIIGYPAVIFTKSLELQQVYTYNITSSETVTLTDVMFSDFFVFKDAMLLKNGNMLGSLDQNLPLIIEAGDQYSIKTAFDFDESLAGNISYYDSLSATIIFQYEKNNNTSNKLNFRLGLVSEGLMNEEFVNEYFESVIGD